MCLKDTALFLDFSSNCMSYSVHSRDQIPGDSFNRSVRPSVCDHETTRDISFTTTLYKLFVLQRNNTFVLQIYCQYPSKQPVCGGSLKN
jgi:hypothetical protein